MVKRAQMKIQQMAFVLIAITLFFALAGLFLVSFAFSGMRESKTKLGEQGALTLVSRLANSPEFSCGNSFDNAGISCVDGDKMMVLRSNSEKYSGFWGDEISNIEIIKIFPRDNILCNSGNYPNCGIISLFENREGFYKENFVSLCRKASLGGESYDKCEIAKLRVGYRSFE
jgi:hypothetical protein